MIISSIKYWFMKPVNTVERRWSLSLLIEEMFIVLVDRGDDHCPCWQRRWSLSLLIEEMIIVLVDRGDDHCPKDNDHLLSTRTMIISSINKDNEHLLYQQGQWSSPLSTRTMILPFLRLETLNHDQVSNLVQRKL
jgi:hypothetical protein